MHTYAQFEIVIINIENDVRANIESQQATLRKLAGIRADMLDWIREQEARTPRVASAGIVEAPTYTVNIDG